jgi:hypothetical protein
MSVFEKWSIRPVKGTVNDDDTALILDSTTATPELINKLVKMSTVRPYMQTPFQQAVNANDNTLTNVKQAQVNEFIDLNSVTTPDPPATTVGRIYVRKIDDDNEGLYIKIKIATVIQEVQIA